MGIKSASAMAVVMLAAAGSSTRAQEESGPQSAPAELGDAALPGGAKVGYAEALPAKLFTLSFDIGGGYRSGLLGDNHKMKRGLADVAVGYAATSWMSLAVAFDGRYDKHTGGGTLTDDGWVGEPRLLVRAARALTPALSLGGQVTLSAPGSNAPSLVPSALSVDARGLVSGRAGALRWALNGGFRLDNSAKSIDAPAALSLADQASLGVSEWNAAVAGARGAYAAGKVALGVEAEARIFLGTDHPGPLVFIGATADVQLNRSWSFTAFAGTNIVDKPTVTATTTRIKLQPYDPAIVGGIGLTARFGGITPAAAPIDVEPVEPNEIKPPAPTYAALSGVVVDDAGVPVPGAVVTITAGDITRELTTDSAGAYAAGELPLGDATITVTSPGRLPSTSTVTLAEGRNAQPSTKLAPVPLSTQLRGTIRSFRGAPLAGKVVVMPGNITVVADANGEFVIDLPAGGTYDVTVSASGFVSQTRKATVTEQAVTIFNFDLRTP